MRLCGITEISRTIQSPRVGLIRVVEDPRTALYLDNVPLRPYAQTLGTYILAREPLSEGTLRHEVEHVRQWRRLGPLFLAAYGLESMRVILNGGHRYFDNRFEVAARAAERVAPVPMLSPSEAAELAARRARYWAARGVESLP